jgi:hypothetical protein
MSNKYLLLILVLHVFVSTSCNYRGIKERTPKEFLNNVVISKKEYKKDSVEIIKQLEEFLEGHENFFYSKEYYDSTQLFVDSIIYSPDFNKLVVFLITQNPTYRQLGPDKKHKWYYNANCYLGIRHDGKIILTSIGPSIRNSVDKDKLTKMIRDTYSSIYSKFKNYDGSYMYKYNVGDIRFWDCPIWKEIEVKKQKKEDPNK